MHSASRSRRAHSYLLVPKWLKNRSRRLSFFFFLSKYPQYNTFFSQSNHARLRLRLRLVEQCFRSAAKEIPDLDPPECIDTSPSKCVCQIWNDTGYWVNDKDFSSAEAQPYAIMQPSALFFLRDSHITCNHQHGSITRSSTCLGNALLTYANCYLPPAMRMLNICSDLRVGSRYASCIMSAVLACQIGRQLGF